MVAGVLPSGLFDTSVHLLDKEGMSRSSLAILDLMMIKGTVSQTRPSALGMSDPFMEPENVQETQEKLRKLRKN